MKKIFKMAGIISMSAIMSFMIFIISCFTGKLIVPNSNYKIGAGIIAVGFLATFLTVLLSKDPAEDEFLQSIKVGCLLLIADAIVCFIVDSMVTFGLTLMGLVGMLVGQLLAFILRERFCRK